MIYNRNKIKYSILMFIVIIIGLGSRILRNDFPGIITEYAGDILWGMMVYLGFCILFTKKSIKIITINSICFAYLIEISQLYQAEWINLIRKNIIGGLILGYSFLWSDIICYSIGIVLGVLTDFYVLKISNN